MLRPYWRTRRRFASRPSGCCASDNAWATFARRLRRPVESASTPITSAPVTAGSGRCSRTNTKPAACSATAVVRVDHPVSAGWGRWATTNGQVAGSNPVRVTSGAPSASARVRQTDRAGPSDPATCPLVVAQRSEEHTSELQSPCNLVCRLLLEKKKTQVGVDERQPRVGGAADAKPAPREHRDVDVSLRPDRQVGASGEPPALASVGVYRSFRAE